MINDLPESPTNVDVDIHGQLQRFTESDFFKRYHVEGMNRIPLEEFNGLKQVQLLQSGTLEIPSAINTQFTRFSLEKNNATIGQNYLVLSIIKKGQDSSNKGYHSPILSLENALIFKAHRVINHLRYEQVKTLIAQQQLSFEDTVPPINSLETLQTKLLQRYQYSRPNLSKQQIINLGVGIVWFTWVGYVSEDGQVKYLESASKKSEALE